MVSQNPVQEIKEKLDIVEVIRGYITLTPAGRNFKAPCPFHKEKTPSFMVSPERQTWHCFGSCGEGGDVFSFVMKYENLEFYEALKLLAEKAGIELRRLSPQDQKQFGILYDLQEEAKTFFESTLARDKSAMHYLEERGLTHATIQEFEIGLAPQAADALTLYLINKGVSVHDIERAGLAFKSERGGYIDRFRGRIMFPLYNHFGKIVGFSGRILPQYEKPEIGKYVNSPETPVYNKSRVLYGFHKNKHSIKDAGEAVIVEGQMDFLMCMQDGIKNVVATSGTALTQDHLKSLRRLTDKIILSFDNDEAGMNAVERGIDLAHTQDFSVRVVIMSDAKDPAETVQKSPGLLKKYIDAAKGGIDFYIHRYLGGMQGGESIHDRKKKIRQVLTKVRAVASAVERAHWVREISMRTGLPEEALAEEMAALQAEKKEPTLTTVVAKPIQGPQSRRERIAERLIKLVLVKEELQKNIDTVKEYLPLDYQLLIKHIVGKEDASNETLTRAAEALMVQAARDADTLPQEKIDQEYAELCKELYGEYLKEKREVLRWQVKDAEREGNEENLGMLLKQFDELSRLMQNK